MTADPAGLQVVSRRVASGSISLFVREARVNDGDPILLLVHGGPALSHDYMEPLEALAAGGLRVVSYDQRGAGQSDLAVAGAYGLAQHVSDVEAIRRAFDAERIHLVGHSWGGLIAMAYAARHAEHMASLVLVSSIGPTWSGLMEANRRFHDHQLRLEREGKIRTSLLRGAPEDSTEEFLALLPAYFADPGRSVPPELARTTSKPRSSRLTWMDCVRYDIRQQLEAVDCPCLIVQGREEPFGHAMAEELEQAMCRAGCHQVIIPDCGHFPWFEQPDAFTRAVLQFIAACSEKG